MSVCYYTYHHSHEHHQTEGEGNQRFVGVGAWSHAEKVEEKYAWSEYETIQIITRIPMLVYRTTSYNLTRQLHLL